MKLICTSKFNFACPVGTPRKVFESSGRLRHCHLDSLSICSSVLPKIPQNTELSNTSTGITQSFFYRAHITWNNLPFEIRNIESEPLFAKILMNYLWKEILSIANLPSDLLDDLDA